MDKKTKIYAIVSTILFFILYFGIKHFQESNFEQDIIGVWESKESNGANFTFTFKKDKTLEIFNGDSTIEMNYKINNKLIELVENELIIKSYQYTIENDTLVLSEKGDKLSFLKKED